MSMPSKWIHPVRRGCMSLLLALLLSCARQPLPLDQDPALSGTDPFLGADLVAASGELVGEPLRDRARLELIEGREGEPLPCAGGWLLQLRRAVDWGPAPGPEKQALLIWLGTGGQRSSRLVARADSLRLVAAQGLEGPLAGVRLLLVERGHEQDEAWRQLAQRDLQGHWTRLVRAPTDKLDWLTQPPRLRLAQEGEARPFRESPGSWHLDVVRPVLEQAEGWKLGPAQEEDSPYRALSEFLDNVRRGHWRAARQRADLARLLALPDGSWSRALQASLESGMPELLQTRVVLNAPHRGPLTRFEDLSGRLAWRVELEPRPQSDGTPRWVLTRLERVLRP